MSLPRELHLWLQSLDLTFPIRHPKRDFANGYLVAEILSCYLPSSELDLHQLRTGLSTEQRLANWSLLERVMARQGWDVTRAEMDAVMHSQPDAHLAFLSHLYTLLTHCKLQTIPPPPAIVASFAPSASVPATLLAPTASTAVKARLHEADIVGGLSGALDETRTVAAVEAALGRHSEDRKDDRRRQASAIRRHMAQQRMVNRQISNAQSTAAASQPAAEACTVKTVTIRQMTPAVSSLSSLTAATAASASSKPAPTRSSIAALNAVVINTPQYSYQQRDQPYAEFVSSLSSLPSDTVAAVLDAVTADALDSLVANAVSSPKDFYLSLGLLWPGVLQLEPLSAGWQSALTLLTQWGQRLRRKDETLSAALCADYLLPKLLPLLATQPAKLHHLLPLLHSFHPDTPQAHAALLASLPHLIASARTLLLCLSALLQLDTNAQTVAVCLPHIDRHLQAQGAVERALALSLLAPVAASAENRTVETYWTVLQAALERGRQQQQEAEAGDAWCETVEAVHVLCCLLASPSELWLEVETVIGMVEKVVSPSAPFAVIVCCLPHLAPHLGLHPPLRSLFFSLLSSTACRQYALASMLPPSVPESVVSLLPLFAADLRSSYSPQLTVRALLDVLRTTRASSLSAAQVQVIAAALSDSVDADCRLNSRGWDELLPPLFPLLLSALPHQAVYVLQMLTIALLSPETRGQALGLLRSQSSAFTQTAGRMLEEQRDEEAEAAVRASREQLLDWLWDWVERRGDDAVVSEALRRAVSSWAERVGQDASERLGLRSLLRQLEPAVDTKGGREEEEQKQRDVHWADES